jgi:hypothetical protein
MENQFNVAAVKEKAAKALLQSANDPEGLNTYLCALYFMIFKIS